MLSEKERKKKAKELVDMNSGYKLAYDLAFQNAKVEQLEKKLPFLNARIKELEEKEIKLDALMIHCERLVRTSAVAAFDGSMAIADTEIVELIKDVLSGVKVLNYPVNIAKDGNSYSVSFPDIPEALTCADTYESALVEAKAALITSLEFYFEDGREVPKPSKVTGEYVSILDEEINQIKETLN